MSSLKYTIIKNKTQYRTYCTVLEELASLKSKSKPIRDEIDLLTLLIEKWDQEQSSFNHRDPVQIVISLIKDHGMKARDLALILKVSKGYVSDILNYKKGFSKETIRILSAHFKIAQEAFNRPYLLTSKKNRSTRRRSSIAA